MHTCQTEHVTQKNRKGDREDQMPFTLNPRNERSAPCVYSFTYGTAALPVTKRLIIITDTKQQQGSKKNPSNSWYIFISYL